VGNSDDASAFSMIAQAQTTIVVPATMKTILLVDDRAPIRELLEVILSRTGYRVIAASDGLSALRLARGEESIDLLLTDLEMPGMRGDALASQFAKLHPHAAIIVTTDSSDTIETDASYDFLAKPFSVAELRDGVRRALRKRPTENAVPEPLPCTAGQK
jgi:two-component system cell cycle sensor histidine kinase/response regulator CckA